MYSIGVSKMACPATAEASSTMRSMVFIILSKTSGSGRMSELMFG